MPDKPPTDTLLREVSAAPEEFRRGLLLAFPGNVTGQGNTLNIATGNAAMEISLTVGPARTIANLRLATLFVSIRFTAGSAEAQQRMLAQMDRAMHRGGG
jgi:hypothetical protein